MQEKTWREFFFRVKYTRFQFLSGYGGTGRRNGLKIRWGQPRAGSIPAIRTIIRLTLWKQRVF